MDFGYVSLKLRLRLIREGNPLAIIFNLAKTASVFGICSQTLPSTLPLFAALARLLEKFIPIPHDAEMGGSGLYNRYD